MNRKPDMASSRKATGKQARKSLATQRQIIETAIQCLAKYGYHDTTYIRISEESGISRGAMRHHFPSRIEIMKATIEHLHNKRLTAFRKSAASFPDGPSRARANVEALWLHVNHPTFMVFIDLALAARKDRELAAIFRPAQRTFRQECYYAALELFPEWLKHREQLRTAIDLTLYMMEGMVLDDLSPDGEGATRLLDFLARELDVLRTEGAAPEDVRDREAPSQKS
jgi:AcrR family transcriptional regulator